MLGAIFGDMAGSVYEFKNIKTTAFDLLGEGTSYTDDTVLTVAVADWILQGALTKDRLIERLRFWVDRYPRPMGGYGLRFVKWVRSEHPVPYNSWGNGSAMRVAPVGWAFDTLEETEAMAALTAEVTHNHPEGVKGAQATAAAIFIARTGATKAAIKAYVEERYGYDLSMTCDEIRPTYEFDESCAGTVPQALVAFLESVDFESAIRLAVSLGGDSDTLACITGGVAEGFYGMKQSLPVETGAGGVMWFEEVVLERLPSDLRDVVKDFYDQVVARKKVFWSKNESATITGPTRWTLSAHEDVVLDEVSYRSFLKGYVPDWDMRFGVYYEDGWHYIYRSHYLLKKFRFEKREDGLYHLGEYYDSEKEVGEDLLLTVLIEGYFDEGLKFEGRRQR